MRVLWLLAAVMAASTACKEDKSEINRRRIAPNPNAATETPQAPSIPAPLTPQPPAPESTPPAAVVTALHCDAIQNILPGASFAAQQRCALRKGSAAVALPSGSAWALSGCPTLSIDTMTGTLQGRIPLSPCTATVTLAADKIYTSELAVKPNSKIKFLGRKFNAPVTDWFYGMEKRGGEYWAHGPAGIHVFDADLKFLRTIARENAGLPNSRVDGLTFQGAMIFAATSAGLARSDDNGASWQLLNVNGPGGAPAWLSGIAATATKLVAWLGSSILVMNFDGSAVTTLTAGSGLPAGSYNIQGLHVIGNTVYVSTNAGVHYSADDGATWNTYTTPNLAHADVTDVWRDASNTLYFSTAAGISRFDGTVWLPAITPASNGTFAQNAVAKTRADGARMAVFSRTYAMHGHPRLGISSDSGTTWEHLDNYPQNCPVPGVGGRFFLEGTRLVLSTQMGLVYSNDFGATWHCTQFNGNLGAYSNGEIVVSNGKIYLGSWGHGLWSSDLDDDTWSVTMLPRVAGKSDISIGYIFGTAIAGAGNEMFFHRHQSYGLEYSSDGGATYTHIPTSTAGIGYFFALRYHQGVLYGGGHGAGFAKSSDKGQTWTVYKTAQGLPHDTVRIVEVGAENRIFIGTDGGLAYTDDGGATWSVRTVAHGLVSNGVNRIAQEGSLVIAYSLEANGYAISKDRGETFTAVMPVSKGLSTDQVYSVAINDGALFISLGDGTFAMSLDQGETWEALLDADARLVLPLRQIYVAQGRMYLKSNSNLIEFVARD